MPIATTVFPFEDNLTIIKKILKSVVGIQSITNIKIEKSSNNVSLNFDNETDDLTISNNFNNFFISVAKNLVN